MNNHRPIPDLHISGVLQNARTTALYGIVLAILFAIEGITILSIRALLSLHVFIGMLLIPFVLVKLMATSWRFIKYYSHAEPYRSRGAPPFILRFIGPLVIISTIFVIVTGIALLYVKGANQSNVLQLHQEAFVFWFAIMAIHFLGHILESVEHTVQEATDTPHVNGRKFRMLSILACGVIGLVLALIVLPRIGPWVLIWYGH